MPESNWQRVDQSSATIDSNGRDEMKEIQLIYAKNIVSRGSNGMEQEIEFFMLVANVAYQKRVDVFWAGEEGRWQELSAEYQGPSGQDREIWRAYARFRKTSKTSLPGSVRFALRCRASGAEYWDNNHHRDYSIDADSGVLVREGTNLLNVEFNPSLPRGRKLHRVTVAAHRSVGPKRVHVHWTTNNWSTHRQTPCFYERYYWHQSRRSNARNPNRYGWLLWTSQIEIDHAYRVEYAISCDTNEGRIWDNNLGRNYCAHRERLKILTLNLHCYQEENQDEKFDVIARAISDLNIDIICLQEVGENWIHGQGDWRSNAARIIRDRLKRSYYLSYHLYTESSHIGFDRYLEGVAILSRYKFQKKNSRYISNSRDIHNIHSRKAVMAQVHVPYMGLVNVYSVHLSWWDAGFQEQFENLTRWVNMQDGDDVSATFLCGDFNVKAGSRGYSLVVASKDYEDQFLKATSRDLFHRIFEQSLQGWENGLADDHRIDYILKKKNTTLKVASARAIFTDQDYGRVSDHLGYLVDFEPM